MSTALSIVDLGFPGEQEKLASLPHGVNWPVVYLIHNDKEIYVGETTSAHTRYIQHADKNGKFYKERRRLNHIKIVFDDSFNKSAILDIEQSLIRMLEADSAIQIELGLPGHHLQNKNAGQSYQHDYYDRAIYQQKVEEIWKKLFHYHLVSNSYDSINNSDLFKYSPYTNLTAEQEQLCRDTIRHMMNCLMNGKKGTTIINGAAGTGKSIVLINMIMTLLKSHYIRFDYDPEKDSEDDLDERYALHCELERFLESWKDKTGHKDLSIGFILPMESIRSTFQMVFKNSSKSVKGMKVKMVIGPNEVIPKKGERGFDVVFVDEAHRLKRRAAMSGTEMHAFDNCCARLGLNPKEANQLDFILRNTKYQVMVYDENQTIKPTDITANDFQNRLKGRNIFTGVLRSQMRCNGGGEFTQYVNDIFDCRNPKVKSFNDYDIRLYNDPNEMINQIVADNKQYGLCRTLAGYSWEWVSSKERVGFKKNGAPKYKKSKKVFNSIEDLKKAGRDYDIVFDGKGYYWNIHSSRWILKSSPEEIGCVHTTQGYDLNRVGIILGKEINYNPETDELEINRNSFFDSKVKEGTDDEHLKTFIINAYKVMLMRGIKGCYLYACNKNLQDYLSRYFPVV